MGSQTMGVMSCAFDITGTDSGSMGCFEAIGLGLAMDSDRGYPEGTKNRKIMLSYKNSNHVGKVLADVLQSMRSLSSISGEAGIFLHCRRGKQAQHAYFIDFVDRF
jgi:hypothetical protein